MQVLREGHEVAADAEGSRPGTSPTARTPSSIPRQSQPPAYFKSVTP